MQRVGGEVREEPPRGLSSGWGPHQVRLKGPDLYQRKSPATHRGAFSGGGRTETEKEARPRERPSAHSPAAGSAPSFYEAKDWLERSAEEVAAAYDKRCFLFPAWESVSDKRE